MKTEEKRGENTVTFLCKDGLHVTSRRSLLGGKSALSTFKSTSGRNKIRRAVRRKQPGGTFQVPAWRSFKTL